MGVPYSHISPEKQAANRKFNEESGMKKPLNIDTVKEILAQVEIHWEAVAAEWCTCSQDGEGLWNGASEGYTFHCPPNLKCPLCKASIDNDHYHCGVCAKISQVG